MKFTYSIITYALILLGIVHCAFTFKKYSKIDLDAIWFCAAGLGLVFCGMINYINTSFSNSTVSKITLMANLCQLILCSFLAFNYPKGKTIFAFVLMVVLLGISTLHFFNTDNAK